MLEVPGKEKQKISFEKFLGYIFQDADAEFFASHGLDCIRLPFTYRHFENDMSPRELKILAFKHLDQFINFLCYVNNHEVPDHQLTVYNLDRHFVIGRTYTAFWDFKDHRTVWLCEKNAEHYEVNTWIAGDNPLNEPCSPGNWRLPAMERLRQVYSNSRINSVAQEIHQERYKLVRAQLAIYDPHQRARSIWLYKDIRVQGMVYTDPDGLWNKTIQPSLEKKRAL
ncbi:hypothetical protein B2J93_1825 [Marssonina coronariae]|uniref:Uncharacterized protein n=1 Tax=Diplocarpon coronariae TaxID=2795749 RepID=A0A218ZDI9_9HELO|nr:hypothetical protein B2J93_1825 [Marssonina coronariae]